MTHSHHLLGLLVAVTLATSIANAADDTPPNVLLIISDDQAWTDYGFMGHPTVETPRLDQLADESLCFTRGYVPTSLCRSSLATMVTGLYPHQHGITGNDPGIPADQKRPKYRAEWMKTRVELDETLREGVQRNPTLPRLLAERGFVSLQTGKWWEGNFARGGFTQGMTHGDPTRGGRHGDAGLKIGREGLDPIFTFIDQATTDQKPFFVWYAPFLPHAPHTPPAALMAKYRDKTPSEPVAAYWAMCEWFDQTCGQLLDYLDENQLAENTLVVYVCDNGWIQNPDQRNRFAPRSKRSPYECGTRTPIMFRMPGRISPSMNRQALASSIDLTPTILAACGLEATDAMPGINLLDAPAVAERTTLFGEIYEHDVRDVNNPTAALLYRWTIDGTTKLILPHAPNLPEAPVELFDLDADPHEKNNLAKDRPECVKTLGAKLEDLWDGEALKSEH